MSNETNEEAKQPVTDCNRLGNAAGMLEALEKAQRVLHCAIVADILKGEDAIKAFNAVTAALSAPPRNCDRPECATTKAAQDIWRKEDGGKTAYYEWLLAPHHRPRGHGDERPGVRARADDRARVLA